MWGTAAAVSVPSHLRFKSDSEDVEAIGLLTEVHWRRLGIYSQYFSCSSGAPGPRASWGWAAHTGDFFRGTMFVFARPCLPAAVLFVFRAPVFFRMGVLSSSGCFYGCAHTIVIVA